MVNMRHDIDRNIEQARQLSKEKRATEAVALLHDCLERATGEREQEEILLELGTIYNGMADFPRALNHFNAVLRVNGDNTRARAYVEMINRILDYYNKELLNP
jgi:tetratricopeptide (TPR) repeat protein